jgi:peptidoglycan/xylan/chitin deacetylase (PgdA/CDA1 family)
MNKIAERKRKPVLTFMFIASLLLFAFSYSLQANGADKPKMVNTNTIVTNGETTVVVPVIMYHVVTSNSSRFDKYCISVDNFESDLKFLQQAGYETVFLEDVANFVLNGQSLPEKPIVLTFDDGQTTDFLNVYPLLQKYKAKAEISIIGKETDKYSAMPVSPGNYHPHLTWNLIEEMSNSEFVRFQNHSYDMHKGNGSAIKSGESKAAFEARFKSDILKLQDRMFEMTGRKPTFYTYPFGAITNGTDVYLKDMGFLGGLSCENLAAKFTQGDEDCLFRIDRLIRPYGKSLQSVIQNALKGIS